MASEAEVDIGQLSPAQQEALQQYTAVTDQEVKDAIPLLQRSQWNVQIAIAKFFDGEGPDPVAEALAAQNDAPRAAAARHENLQESLYASAAGTGPRVPRTQRTEAAPRIVPRQPSTTRRPSFLMSILFAPFNLGFKLFSTFFRAISYILAFLPAPIRPRAVTGAVARTAYGRRQLLPRDTAARFRREFEEQYGASGASELPLFEGGYAQAYDAAKKDLKFLLVVLVAPEHDDNDAFLRGTLLAPEVVDFVREPANNIILWAGNVRDSEAHQIALEYQCTKYPFACLVCLTPKEGSTRMGVVKRLVGPVSPAALLAGLRTAIGKYGPDIEAVRAERAANEAARSIRTEQDSAYERSLAADRERARRRREAEAEAAAAERRAREQAEAARVREEKKRQWRRWRAKSVPAEPAAGDRDVVRVALKLPEDVAGGERIRRAFASGTTLEELYAFVECYDIVKRRQQQQQQQQGGGEVGEDEDADVEEPEGYVHEYGFRIAALMPREVYEPTGGKTLGEAIGRSGNLIVESVVPEEAEEEEGGEEDAGGF